MTKILYGQSAIDHIEYLEKLKNPLNPWLLPSGAKLLILHEGYSEEVYEDDKGVPTRGVGQTGRYATMEFPEVYQEFLKEASRLTKGFHKLPQEAQDAILLATYRGTWRQSPKTRRLLAQGDYEGAAKEFLRNDEYLQRKAKKPKTPGGYQGDGVTKRMEYIASVLANLGTPKDTQKTPKEVSST